MAGPSVQRLALSISFVSFLAACAVLLFPGAQAATVVGPATYSTDTTWALSGSPYYVEGDITVASNATLTVEPGVEVRFDATDFGVTVFGGFSSAGTSAAPIQFVWNGTLTDWWAGVALISPNRPVEIRYTRIDHGYDGLSISSPQAPVTLENLTMYAAIGLSLNVTRADSTFSISNLSIPYSAFGVQIKDSAGFNVSRVVIDNLYRNEAHAMRLENVSDVNLEWLDFDYARMQILSSHRISIANFRSSQGDARSGLEVTDSSFIKIENAAIQGYYNVRFNLLRTHNVTITNFTTTTLGSPDGVVLLADRCPDLRVSNGTSTGGSLAFGLDESPRWQIDNFTSGPVARGLFVTWSAFFVLDNASFSGGYSSGFYVRDSGNGSIVKNTAFSGFTQGVEMDVRGPAAQGMEFDLDFSVGNSINGTPILAFYKRSDVIVQDPGNIGWFYAYAAPRLYVSGANLSSGSCDPGMVVVDSPGFTFVDSVVRAAVSGVTIENSDGVLLSGVQVTAFEDALHIRDADGTVVSNSSFNSTNSFGFVFVFGSNVTLTGVRATGGTAGASLYGSAPFVVTDSYFSGSSVGLYTYANLVLENSTACSAGTGLSVSGGGHFSNVSLCAGTTGVLLEQTSGSVVEHMRFIGQGVGVSIQGGGANTIRWNEFGSCRTFGVVVSGSSGTPDTLYENNFRCGSKGASDTSGRATNWDDPSRRRGNYWNNYAGTDADGDFIGDTAHTIANGSHTDEYPLMYPWDRSPPVAVISLPSVVDEGTYVFLDGLSSTDNLGVLIARWEIEGPPGLATRAGLGASYTFVTPGNYTVRFFLSDGMNNDTAFVSVFVRDRSAPAITPGTNPLLFDEDVEYTISFAVTDNDPAFPAGAPFDWTFTGPLQFAFSTTGPTLAVNFTQPGTYAATFQVKDPSGNTATQNFSVQVADRTAPVCQFSPVAATYAQGAVASFSITNAQDNDPAFPGATAFAWSLEWPDGTTSSQNGQAWDVQLSLSGTYNATGGCRDPSGNVASWSAQFIATDTAPPVWNPPARLTVADGAAANFSVANATDVSGLTGATWADGSSTIGSGLNTSVVLEGLGHHTITVTLSDALGNSKAYAFEVDVVDRTAPRLVDANFTSLRTLTVPGRIELDAGGALADNDHAFAATANFNWSTDAPAGALTSNGSKATITLDAAGNYNVWLSVADAAGNRLNLSVIVKATSQAPPPPGGGVNVGGEGTLLLVLVAAVAGAGAVGGLVMKRRRSRGPTAEAAPVAPQPAEAPQESQAESDAKRAEYERLYGPSPPSADPVEETVDNEGQAP